MSREQYLNTVSRLCALPEGQLDAHSSWGSALRSAYRPIGERRVLEQEQLHTEWASTIRSRIANEQYIRERFDEAYRIHSSMKWRVAGAVTLSIVGFALLAKSSVFGFVPLAAAGWLLYRGIGENESTTDLVHLLKQPSEQSQAASSPQPEIPAPRAMFLASEDR